MGAEDETSIIAPPRAVPEDEGVHLTVEEYERLKRVEKEWEQDLLLIRSHLHWLYGFLSSRADDDDAWAINARDGVERALKTFGGIEPSLRKDAWPRRTP